MNSGSNSQMTPSCKLPIKFDFLRPPYIEKKKEKKKNYMVSGSKWESDVFT